MVGADKAEVAWVGRIEEECLLVLCYKLSASVLSMYKHGIHTLLIASNCIFGCGAIGKSPLGHAFRVLADIPGCSAEIVVVLEAW